MMTPPSTSSYPKLAFIVVCAIVVVIVTAIGMAANVNSGPQLPPGAGALYFSDYQAGDCLFGDFPNTTGGVWPDPVWVVPCDEPHTDEVFYVNASYFSWAGGAYPGDSSVQAWGSGQCADQFSHYVGVVPAGSIYSFTYIAPDAQTWQDGDRELVCVAYDPTSAKPNGDVIRQSIRNSAQ